MAARRKTQRSNWMSRSSECKWTTSTWSSITKFFATKILIASSTIKGANAALIEARDAGKIRFIGFTGHKDPRIHLYMLEVAKQNRFDFDAVQMPLNVMDAHYRSFEKMVLPQLVKEHIG